MATLGMTIDQKLLWRGRSCFWGIECGWTTYSLWESRLLITDFFGNQTSIPCRKIGSIKISRTFGDWVFGTGSLMFDVEGRGRVTIPHIKNPHTVESQLHYRESKCRKYMGAYKEL